MATSTFVNTGKIRSALLFFAAIILLGFAGCSKDQADKVTPDPTGNDVTPENVNYSNFVGELFRSKCSSCHAAGGSASSNWTFSGYSSVRTNADRINNVVLVTRAMPMGGSLTTKERELLTAWFARSLPEN